MLFLPEQKRKQNSFFVLDFKNPENRSRKLEKTFFKLIIYIFFFILLSEKKDCPGKIYGKNTL